MDSSNLQSVVTTSVEMQSSIKSDENTITNSQISVEHVASTSCNLVNVTSLSNSNLSSISSNVVNRKNTTSQDVVVSTETESPSANTNKLLYPQPLNTISDFHNNPAATFNTTAAAQENMYMQQVPPPHSMVQKQHMNSMYQSTNPMIHQQTPIAHQQHLLQQQQNSSNQILQHPHHSTVNYPMSHQILPQQHQQMQQQQLAGIQQQQMQHYNQGQMMAQPMSNNPILQQQHHQNVMQQQQHININVQGNVISPYQLHPLSQMPPTTLETNEDSNPDDTESLDSNSSRKDASPRVARNSARSVTMQTLLKEGALEPGNGVLSIDYLGQKFTGDLLPNGKIHWDKMQFASPSSWATFIKKKINPSKKSGCGWNSVKYKGKKLDKLKSNWFRKNHVSAAAGISPNTNDEILSPPINTANLILDNKMVRERRSMKYVELKQQVSVDPNTIIEYEHFNGQQGKPQPFSVVVSTSVLLLIDFHSHLTTSEVTGYLGGRWNANKRCLYIVQAFPCKCKQCDLENAVKVEQEISAVMQQSSLLRVGWYHSHPTSQAEPTLRDIDVQYSLQMSVSNSYPLIGIICSPFDVCDVSRTESIYSIFSVAPAPEPPESGLPWYGVPMKLNYTEQTDHTIPPEILHEMKKIYEYCRLQPDVIGFAKLWRGNTTYLDKIKISLSKKLPRTEKGGSPLIQFIQEMLSGTVAST